MWWTRTSCGGFEACVADAMLLWSMAIVLKSWEALRQRGYVVDEDKLRRV